MGVRVFLLLGLLHLAQSKVWDLSCAQIKVLVDGHNERRLMVANGELPKQPPAAEMSSLVWDEELAEKAKELASTYPTYPMAGINDELSDSLSGRFDLVSSIMSSVPVPLDFELNLNDTLKDWFKNNQFYTFGPWDIIDPQAGFYTQMVWSDSIYLGCAVSEQEKGSGKTLYVVCNYGPGGNVVGEFPYIALPSGHGRGYEKLECRFDDCSHPYGSKC